MSGIGEDLRKLHGHLAYRAKALREDDGNSYGSYALDEAERAVETVLFRYGLAEGHAPNPRASTRDVSPDAPDFDAEKERAEKGTPWCDTCSRPSVAMEGHGLRHSTTEHRFGVPTHLDPHGDHKVSHRQWFATPTSPEGDW